MPRKTATIEREIAQEFRKFLRENPKMLTGRKFIEFDRIADKYYAHYEDGDNGKSTSEC